MKGKYYTVQIIPEDSKEIKKFRVSTKWFFFLKVFLVVLIVVLGIAIFNMGRIGRTLVKYEKMRMTNAQLVKQNANYEELFLRIDSLWVLEERIQNILGTFVENDSNKVNSLIDKNRFAHTPSQKIDVDYEGIHGWKPPEEKIRLEHVPNVIPVVGIVSKKFSEENGHLGTDFSAQPGDPVFASGSGIVEFAGQKDELGNTVIINHQNGYVTSYSHLKDIRTRKGRNVGKGEIIGTVGSTGNSSAPHLHYTITREGREMDPELFINY
ncbi:M23 family metallopeptidase [uncultured Fibrobacter sp.]|uniref:M23 family metallopeptidase n=1 Tax=uncultured Fibrobacter sp. TaxID=261512 RepID=UPI0026280821|nr:M23 family metallopeptidase [uncultured Fibrobacter sp.]